MRLGLTLLGALDRIMAAMRVNWSRETIAGKVFSTRTGSDLSLALVPQTRVPV